MAWVEIASDDFTGVTAGVSIAGRSLAGSAGLVWADPVNTDGNGLRGVAGGVVEGVGPALNGNGGLKDGDGNWVHYRAIKMSVWVQTGSTGNIGLLFSHSRPSQSLGAGAVYMYANQLNLGKVELRRSHGADTSEVLASQTGVGHSDKKITFEYFEGTYKIYVDDVEQLSSTIAMQVPDFYPWILCQTDVTGITAFSLEVDNDADAAEPLDGWTTWAKDDGLDHSAGDEVVGLDWPSWYGEPLRYINWPSRNMSKIGTFREITGRAVNTEGYTAIGDVRGSPLQVNSFQFEFHPLRDYNAGGSLAVYAYTALEIATRINGYRFTITNSGSNCLIERLVNGSATTLVTYTSTYYGQDRYTVTVEPGVQKIQKNGGLLGSAASDTTFAHSLFIPCFYVQNTTQGFKEFRLRFRRQPAYPYLSLIGRG